MHNWKEKDRCQPRKIGKERKEHNGEEMIFLKRWRGLTEGGSENNVDDRRTRKPSAARNLEFCVAGEELQNSYLTGEGR